MGEPENGTSVCHCVHGKKNPYTVYGIQLTRNALKDDNKKMRGRKAETEKQRQKSRGKKLCLL